MAQNKHFELIRQSDGLIYKFDRKEKEQGIFGYQRQDADLWITYHDKLGWIAYDDENKTITGKPWEILPEEQSKDFPPEGIWISRKGLKSYVYELKYIQII